MNKPHLVNAFHALVLIVAGLASYFLNENRPMTALIAPAVGVLLLVMTPGIKNENRIVAHIAVVLTFIFLLVTANMFFKALFPSEKMMNEFDADVLMRRVVVFGLMSISGVFALVVYILGFVAKRKEKNKQNA